MKKIFVLMAALLLGAAVHAQQPGVDAAPAPPTGGEIAPNPVVVRGYTLAGNKLYSLIGEKSEPVQNTVTLENGTTITASGLVTTKDGKQQYQMKNGQRTDLNGNLKEEKTGTKTAVKATPAKPGVKGAAATKPVLKSTTTVKKTSSTSKVTK